VTDANYTQAQESADFLRARLDDSPEYAILTGTGLGDITAAMEVHTSLAYDEIPHFPLSTVQSHHGRWVAGRMSGQRVVVMQGRFHLYEGYSARQVTFPIRVLQALGVKTLVLTNASGGLNPGFATGDIMLISDHLNLTGANPLIGANDDQRGPRFPDMTAAYDDDLRRRALEKTRRLGLTVRQGVYAGLKGPSLETPAEMRYLRTIGADAVGFSTVMETIAAVHAGMRVMGLSIITNMNLPDDLQPASVEAIIAVAQQAAPGLEKLIKAVIA
jgi:purine-nucleoside phosphorylase